MEKSLPKVWYERGKAHAKRATVLRTHGGLGNQLFQIFYGRLFSEAAGTNLAEVHDDDYHHHFQRSEELSIGLPPSGLQALISRARLPKIATKFGLSYEPSIRFGDHYLDGYFQTEAQYRSFPRESIRRHLHHLRDELRIEEAPGRQTLVHLRLGDFFATKAEAQASAAARLQSVPPSSAVMSNDEQLLGEPELATLIAARNCEVLSTAGWGAEDIVRMMADFQLVITNDSTLAFWGSLLGGGDLQLQNGELGRLHAFLRSVDTGGSD